MHSGSDPLDDHGTEDGGSTHKGALRKPRSNGALKTPSPGALGQSRPSNRTGNEFSVVEDLFGMEQNQAYDSTPDANQHGRRQDVKPSKKFHNKSKSSFLHENLSVTISPGKNENTRSVNKEKISERKVQYGEDSLDNELSNLKITVTGKQKSNKAMKSPKKSDKGERNDGKKSANPVAPKVEKRSSGSDQKKEKMETTVEQDGKKPENIEVGERSLDKIDEKLDGGESTPAKAVSKKKKRKKKKKKNEGTPGPASTQLGASEDEVVNRPAVKTATKKNADEMGLEQAEKRLKKDFIFKLEKKSTSFPSAVYFCRACSHHFDSINIANRHIKEKRHKTEMKVKQQNEILRQYKTPPPAALVDLSSHLEEVIGAEMLTENDVCARQKFVDKLNSIVGPLLPDCNFVMFGSSVTTFGVCESDVNVDIEHSGEMTTPAVLIRLADILKSSEDLVDVREDFDAKVPSISATEKESKLRCSISPHNSKSVYTTRLLKLYSEIEPAVTQLCKVFRLWGRFCGLDDQQQGSIAPHCYAIMAIYFLQQRHGLPVLHEIVSQHDIDTVLSKCAGWENILKRSEGEWWYYPTAAPVNKEDDKMEVDDTTDFTDQLESDYDITFETPRKEKEILPPEDRPLVPTKVKSCFEDGAPSIGELWVNLLKFFTAQLDVENIIVTIRVKGKVSRTDRGWSHRRLAIEDPCSIKWNVCRSLTSQALFSFFQERLRFSLKYFFTNHKTDVDNIVQRVLDSAFDELRRKYSPHQQTDEAGNEGKIEKVEADRHTTKYLFARSTLMNGKTPITVCSICKQEGHSKKKCPDEVALELKPLPEMTPELKRMLDFSIRLCFDMFSLRKEEIRNRDTVCDEILKHLREVYDPKVCLQLFGSSRNRFTFRGSDLDICLTFEGNETGEGLNHIEIIESLAKSLRKHSKLRHIIPITTAKVPIVKFSVRSGLEGDISLYNLLAQRNTTMLALYAQIDKRCQILGYAIKAFVKECEIGDASRGSLSSYAYILLVIYYLQQRDPPVLPVLQELHEGDKPELMVDGWNSWFFDDIDNLDKVWQRRNTESEGELWLGLLRFYTEDFDYRRHVVSIRQKRLLTSFEKEWTSKFICIEDPFNLSHNLGSGVSRKMTNFIKRIFVKARERFGNPPGPELENYRRCDAYFFDSEALRDGQEVPNDRCCKICGKIGHFLKDCPKKRLRKRGNDEDKNDGGCFICGKPGHMKRECPNSVKSPKPIEPTPAVAYRFRRPDIFLRNNDRPSPGKPLQQISPNRNKRSPFPSGGPPNFIRNLSGKFEGGATNQHFLPPHQTPPLGEMLTLAEIESKIPGSGLKKNFPQRQNNPPQPNRALYTQHSLPPMSPLQYHPQFSPYPPVLRNINTPPTGQFYHPMPQNRMQQPALHHSRGFTDFTEDPIPTQTFINSGGDTPHQRQVHLSQPSDSPYHSYPPNRRERNSDNQRM